MTADVFQVGRLSRDAAAARAAASRLAAALRIAPHAALAAMSVLTLINVVGMSGIAAWGHDDLHNMADGLFPFASDGPLHGSVAFSPSYIHNVKSEGRWLTYLVSGALLRLPQTVWWMVGYAGFATFCWAAARQVADRLYAIVVALLLLQSPAFIAQSFWPAGAAPALVLLGAFSLLSLRAPPAVLFPIAGVALFATLPPFYFLLPLLYVRRTAASRRPLASALGLLTLWAASLGLGCLVAAAINQAAFGRFGFAVAAWREPHPIGSLADLAANLGRAGAELRRSAAVVLGGPFLWAPAAAALALRVAAKPDPRAVAAIAAIGLSCMLAQFVVTLPIGVQVAVWSLAALGAGPLVIAFLHTPATPLLRGALSLLALPPFLAAWSLSHDEIRYLSVVGRVYAAEARRAAPRPPETYEGVMLLDGDAAAMEGAIVDGFGLERPADLGLGDNVRWMPAARAAGFRRVVNCRQAADFCAARTPEQLADCAGAPGFYCVRGVSADGMLIVSLMEPRRAE